MTPFTAAKLGAVHGNMIVVVGSGKDAGRLMLGFLRLSRSLACGNEADFQRLRLDDHAADLAFDQITIRNGNRVLAFTSRC